MSWKTKNPGEILGKKRYLEILDAAFERSKPGYKETAKKSAQFKNWWDEAASGWVKGRE